MRFPLKHIENKVYRKKKWKYFPCDDDVKLILWFKFYPCVLFSWCDKQRIRNATISLYLENNWALYQLPSNQNTRTPWLKYKNTYIIKDCFINQYYLLRGLFFTQHVTLISMVMHHQVSCKIRRGIQTRRCYAAFSFHLLARKNYLNDSL